MLKPATRTVIRFALAWLVLFWIALPTGLSSVRAAGGAETPDSADGAAPSASAPSSSPSPSSEPANVQHQAYIAGYPDGTFKPDRALTRAELACVLARAVQREEIGSIPAFTDVDTGHWAYPGVAAAVRMRLMEGTTAGQFEPDRPVTAGELTIVFGRLLGSETEAASMMNDHAPGKIAPKDPVSRAEFVVWMNLALRRGPLSGAPQQWSDVPENRAEYGDVQEASISHVYDPTPDGSERWGESAW